MKRTLTTAGLLCCGALAVALSSFGSIFNKTYDISPSSALGKAGCGVCHTTKHGGKLNPYGKDLQQAMKTAKAKKLTAEILHKIDKLDSTKTGSTNLAKIKAGKNPGVD